MKEYTSPKMEMQELEDILATSAENDLVSSKADVFGETAEFDTNWVSLMGEY